MSDDFSELAALASDLGKVPPAAAKNVRKALEVTARSIKEDWREGAAVAHGYADTYAPSIDYDFKPDSEGVTVDIGPHLGKTPGASAGFLEDAPGNVQAPAQHAGRDALEANEDDFYQGLEIAVFEALGGILEG